MNNPTIENLYRAIAEHGGDVEGLRKQDLSEADLHKVLVNLVKERAKPKGDDE